MISTVPITWTMSALFSHKRAVSLCAWSSYLQHSKSYAKGTLALYLHFGLSARERVRLHQENLLGLGMFSSPLPREGPSGLVITRFEKVLGWDPARSWSVVSNSSLEPSLGLNKFLLSRLNVGV